MRNCCTNCLIDLPDLTVYMNCDTLLAINLGILDIGENDEFIFTIKNYDYIDSSYVFIFRATKSDIDDNGEVIFKITPETSKHIKPSAFYSFAVFKDAFNTRKETAYRKLTSNGKIRLEYGAQDMLINPDTDDKTDVTESICGVELELVDEVSSVPPTISEILGMRLEPVDEEVSND